MLAPRFITGHLRLRASKLERPAALESFAPKGAESLGLPNSRSANPKIDKSLLVDQELEPAVHDALHVERHRRLVHLHSRVLHHFCVDPIAMGPRLEDDPGKDRRLIGLGLDRAGERHEPLHLEVVADTFAVLERTVLAPDPARLLREAAVSVHTLLWNRSEERRVGKECRSR